MKPSEVVATFHRSVEEGDWATFDSVIADDFTFSGSTLEPLGKRACISMHKALWGGFPDLQFNLRIISEKGNRVRASVRIAGTHTGTLIPPVPGKFVSFPATGKRVHLPEEPADYVISNNQLVEMHVEPDPEAGWRGIFKQLGVQSPYE
jgi:predicted ester cyclase